MIMRIKIKVRVKKKEESRPVALEPESPGPIWGEPTWPSPLSPHILPDNWSRVRAQVSDSDILNFSGEDSLASSKAGALAVIFASGEPTSLRIDLLGCVCGLFEIGFH
jgi:hypothetical protein